MQSFLAFFPQRNELVVLELHIIKKKSFNSLQVPATVHPGKQQVMPYLGSLSHLILGRVGHSWLWPVEGIRGMNKLTEGFSLPSLFSVTLHLK